MITRAAIITDYNYCANKIQNRQTRFLGIIVGPAAHIYNKEI